MGEKLNILEEEILNTIDKRKAKPNKSIKEHTEDLIKVLEELKELGYIMDDKIYDLVEKACIYHDLGKVNDEFQKRVTGKSKKFNEEKEVAHNVLSLYFIDKSNFSNEGDYLKVAHSVIQHHNYCNVFEEVKNKEVLIKELLKDFNTFKVKRSCLNKLSQVVEDREGIKIKGYLHKCDYSASSGNVAEYKNDFLENSMGNLLGSWKKSNPKANWNDLQRFAIENREENIMGIAQTGMGKTEAGLLWIGNTKGFFILPIRTAINAIYDRIRTGILGNKEFSEKVAILHSSSLEYYIKNIETSILEKENIDLMNYQKIGKQLSIPLNISTMDQLFDFVYKYPGYELKLTTLAYSKIVIDEIQMYGPDLLAYLIYGLEKIVEHGGKIAILTATLPPFVKELLCENINFKESEKPFTNDMRRHNLKINTEKINSKDIYEKYRENKANNKNNKILVVCNTIRKAQEVYDDIVKELGSSEVNILHSKFIRKDRLEKEREILDFGKTFDENGKVEKENGIWISTSIVEASLDIDFDYLFTELQELNSLFQRLGRCNRKGVKNSTDYNCYIYTEIDESDLINGDRGFIDRKLYELSREAIINLDGQITEEEKITLIDKYLTMDKLKDSNYMIEYRNTYRDIKSIPAYKFDIKDIDLRNILSEDIIPSPIYEKYLGEIKELEEKLLKFDLSTFERVNLKDKIREYTVSVHPNDVRSYKRALGNGKAITYRQVSLSSNKNDTIEVIECEYDEAGYKKMKYDKATRGGEFF